jgi:hypothetical protein
LTTVKAESVSINFMGQKYRLAKDGIDEKSQGWQWSGQGASKHLEAETPPDRLAFFMPGD